MYTVTRKIFHAQSCRNAPRAFEVRGVFVANQPLKFFTVEEDVLKQTAADEDRETPEELRKVFDLSNEKHWLETSAR
ncbi:MAG: hypothetical protein Q8L87_19630 [Anaerolineales bacterium]|nr:hypothetical protein [Anaerolineales bacterium]